MVDIVGGLLAASEAIKLARELNAIDRDLNRAELKIRLVEVIDKLLEAKEALQDAKLREHDLRSEISNLRSDAIRDRSLKHDGNGRMFETLDDGKVAPIPFCSTCYINENKLFPMKRYGRSQYNDACFRCFNCKTEYFD